ncbi:RIP metalloprotease RseP [Elizabethkingia argentiflava]|uniref:Zinc metalloprotease n=1 Tax=Elizabethkingia argenteiflava TaxID=2681556 RepID=A0A845PW00_9FLAO|nr:RIP metalloprotease RseP [Elizabethkingia argenteiflava]NAW50488.1 RIP metalloprotease RseP [Elizabethkingia argenteiflava]
MELFNQIFQFVLSISILIGLHELGHFIPAKYFKTRVEKFYLFFDPWFSILKKKIGETEYGIGWLPLGGYVKIAGMVDESMDTEQLKKPAQAWEFRSKPAWQRLIIMLGGVTVNFFLAWLIYACLSYFKGETYSDNAKFENGIYVSAEGQKMGLETGDKILKINGKPAKRMEESMLNMLFADNVTVLRNGKEITFPIDENGVAEVMKANEVRAYFSPRFVPVVDSILPHSGAQAAGLQKGDQILAVNGKPTLYYDEVNKEITSHASGQIKLGVKRNAQHIDVQVQVNKDGKIGFSPDPKFLLASYEKTRVTEQYGLLEAIPRGFTRTIDILVMQVKQFKIIFNQKTKGYTKVAGPIGIVKQMPTHIDWPAFWSFTAMFSVWLAFLNLIPIPGLDGGHVFFTLWEMITGKAVPQKVLENAQMIGVIFLLGLTVLIFGSDIYKLIFK